MRLRITFSKGGPLAYTSHLDLMRAWERSLRRAGVPLAYSQGFNPRPKMQLADALPLGHTAEGELLDIWLEETVPVETIARALVPVLPEGLSVSEVRQVVLDEPSLPAQVASARYQVELELCEPGDAIDARIAEVLAASELVQERNRPGRKKKVYDLRSLIERLELEETVDGIAVLGMQLAARPGATARPEAVLKALGVEGAFARFHRRGLVLK